MIYGILPMHAWILGALFLYQDINGALGVCLFLFSLFSLPHEVSFARRKG